MAKHCTSCNVRMDVCVTARGDFVCSCICVECSKVFKFMSSCGRNSSALTGQLQGISSIVSRLTLRPRARKFGDAPRGHARSSRETETVSAPLSRVLATSRRSAGGAAGPPPNFPRLNHVTFR